MIVPPGLRTACRPPREVVDVRHVGVDVVAGDEVRLFALGGQLAAKLLAEEFAQHGYAQLGGGVSGTGCRLDTEAWDAGSDKIAQQVAIVGRDLDHETSGGKPEAGDHVSGVAGGMSQPTGGGAREIRVVGTEQFICPRMVFGLYQPAVATDHYLERIVQLRTLEVGRLQVGIGRWRTTEVKKSMVQRSSAVAAFHATSIPWNCGVSKGCS